MLHVRGESPWSAEAPCPENFWREHTIDELAVAQGIVAPQQIGKLFGAAADLWDDESMNAACSDDALQRGACACAISSPSSAAVWGASL